MGALSLIKFPTTACDTFLLFLLKMIQLPLFAPLCLCTGSAVTDARPPPQTHVLMIIDDSDLHEEHVPCEPAQLARLASEIKSLLSSHFWRSIPGNSGASPCEAMKHAALALARSIFDRHARRPLTSDVHWMESASLSYVMAELPQAIPFDLRYKKFLAEVADLKRANMDRPHVVHIRRALFLEDGIRAFDDAAERLRGPIKVCRLCPAPRGISSQAAEQVMFVNDSGLPEAGIDAGGVFKEFLSTLVERAFDANLGLFLRNPASQLYPNPDSAHVVPNDTKLFEFVGSVLGKAVFEGIQVSARSSRQNIAARCLVAAFLLIPCPLLTRTVTVS